MIIKYKFYNYNLFIIINNYFSYIMYNNYKIHIIIPFGRHYTLKYLLPHLLDNEIIDSIDLFINTFDDVDLKFADELYKSFNKINIINIDLPYKESENIRYNVFKFYNHAVNHDTIYIKIDDDVIYLTPNLIENIIKQRIQYTDDEYLLISPFVINNHKCNYLLQIHSESYNKNVLLYKYFHEYTLLWDRHNNNTSYNKDLYRNTHIWYMNNCIKNNNLIIDDNDKVNDTMVNISTTRFSINCICWYGKTMDKIINAPVRIITRDDEEYLTTVITTYFNVPNGIYISNNNAAVHWSFFTQFNTFPDVCNEILEMYNNYYEDIWKNNIIYNKIKDIISNIKNNN